jgi:hypothetical protein
MLSHSSSNPSAGSSRRGDARAGRTTATRTRGGVAARPAVAELADPVVVALEAGQRARLVDELIDGTGDGDLLPLDAVGGTIVYMRANLVWEGLNFPSYYV